jgi:hypothetical protein
MAFKCSKVGGREGREQLVLHHDPLVDAARLT